MRRPAPYIALALLALLCLAPSAQASVGLSKFDVSFLGPKGETVSQAGSHPFALRVSLVSNTVEEGGRKFPDEAVKDLEVTNIPGLAGDPTAVPVCPTLEFLVLRKGTNLVPECPDSSAVGVVEAEVGSGETIAHFDVPVYNLSPPPGSVAKIGFYVQSVPITIDFGLTPFAPYRIIAHTTNVSQVLEFFGATLTLWGVPSDPRHDKERGACEAHLAISCPAGITAVPFLTLPRACAGPLASDYAVDSWQHPGARLPDGEPDLQDPLWATGSVLTHGDLLFGGLGEELAPEPLGMQGCGALGFAPQMSAVPSTRSADSAAGLDVGFTVKDEGLLNKEEGAAADSDIEKIALTLPAGMTLDPSAAEGLDVCTPAQFETASLTVAGCQDASKLGSVEVETPILAEKVLRGQLYIGSQETSGAGGSNFLSSIYLVIRNPELGIFVKQAGKVQASEGTGQIITTFEDIPQFPLSNIAVHLRSGPRAPLITPGACGTYAVTATLTPYSGGHPVTSASPFTIDSGPGGGACPAGASPFSPGFEAGAANNAASYFSPFAMRLTRADGEQDLTRFSATLPPGVVPKLAGIAKCSDAAIAAAENKNRTGREEQASPSCPASSQVGHVLAGAGVGTALTYVPGSLYLAGPYKGDPLSVVAIVPAVAGPFDVGTIVTRVALNLNPVTYRGEVDGSKSDPIPHILKGIPLKVRDIRVYADHPDFTLNSTSCAPSATNAQIFGSGVDVFNPADDVPVAKESRYQASSCASLAFKPKLSLNLKGGIKRDKNPALSSTITYPYPSGPGYANIGKAVVTLPPSEFIDPDHINNPCTRVQFNANQCPTSSILGTAKAISPLLDEPLEGPVIFRSNGGERKLPDVVVDLHGLVRITLVGFVDTATPKTSPRIRTTFSSVPDAPVSSFTLNLYGGKKGLLVNNRNLCKHKLKAKSELTGQNGRVYNTEPVVKVASCKGGSAAKKSGRRR